MDPQAGSISQITGDGAEARVAQQNLLLDSLPDVELTALLDHAERFKSPLRELFFEMGDPIERVYFPLTGLASLVTVLKDGTSLEAMTVGREGFVGLPLFHRITTHRSKGMCQMEGEFYRIPADAFTRVLTNAPELRAMLHRYSQYTNEVLAQSAACNSSHMVEQRCARWLLTTSDAIGKTRFNLTQEFLSQMLAVRRPGVTVAMGALVRRSLISTDYGAVTLLDVEGLQKAACECYGTIRDSARDLLS